MVSHDEAAIAALTRIAHGERVDEEAKAILRSYGDDDPEQGLALQVGVLRSWQAAGEQIGGWKIGMTTRTARDSMGAGFRPFGYVLASRIRDDGVVLAEGEVKPNAGVEIEIGLTVGRRLAGQDVTAEQARAAVDSVHPAFELVTRRLPSRVGVPIRLGNSLGNWGIVFGEGQDPALPLDSLDVAMFRDDEEIGRGGTGPDVVDSPYESLARVARVLDTHGLALEPGQRVITGSLLPALPVTEPATFVGDFGPLGKVTATFAGSPE